MNHGTRSLEATLVSKRHSHVQAMQGGLTSLWHVRRSIRAMERIIKNIFLIKKVLGCISKLKKKKSQPANLCF